MPTQPSLVFPGSVADDGLPDLEVHFYTTGHVLYEVDYPDVPVK